MGARADGRTLLFDVWVVANSTRALLDDALRPSGLNAEEFALYSALRRDGGVTPTELAALMAFPSTTVSSIVARIGSSSPRQVGLPTARPQSCSRLFSPGSRRRSRSQSRRRWPRSLRSTAQSTSRNPTGERRTFQWSRGTDDLV